MRALLDTNVALFMWGDPGRLSPVVRNLLKSTDHQFLFSQVSTWEICLKYRTGKLPLNGESPRDFLHKRIRQSELTYDAISDAALFRSADLPSHHQDPFDRLLIATAQILDIPILTSDAAFHRYKVEVIW